MITTIAVAATTAAVLAILFSVYRIVRDVQSVSDKIAKGGDLIAGDLSAVRDQVRAGMGKIFRAALAAIKNMGRKERKRKEKKEEKANT